jgi:hypothetical protein
VARTRARRQVRRRRRCTASRGHRAAVTRQIRPPGPGSADARGRRRRAAPRPARRRSCCAACRPRVPGREPGGRPAFPGLVLPERDDPRRGPQRVAEPRDTAEGQAAIEEVRLDVLGDHRRLPDRDIPDQAGRCHRATAGDLVAQLMVEGEREPVPGDGLMRGGQPWCQREAGGAAEVLADASSSKYGPSTAGGCIGHAP